MIVWPGYETWNEKRFRVISSHVDLRGRICDLAAGHGYFSEECYKLGAEVVSVEGNAKHVQELKNLANGRWQVQQLDLDSCFPAGSFDVILCLGILYHVAYPQELLRQCCDSAGIVVIETAILDSKSSDAIVSYADAEALGGTGYFPSPGWVEKNMNLFGFVSEMICEPTALNDGAHYYSWTLGRSMRYEGRRALWVCRSQDVVRTCGE